MLNVCELLGWFSLSLFVVQASALASFAQAPAEVTVPGICLLPFRAGRMVVAPDGRLMNLPDYCALSQPEPPVEPAPAQSDIRAESTFWQSFVTAASPAVLDFAEQLGKDRVIEYGASICPNLRNGLSLDTLRQTQADGQTSVAFEASVTVAAVITDCPEFRSQLGRFSSGAVQSSPLPPESSIQGL